MSVVSKIFIIVNLLLTVLLLATMGQKIDYKFDGAYKKQYKENVKSFVDAKQALKDALAAKKEQLSTLNKQEKKKLDAKAAIESQLAEAKSKRDSAKTAVQQKQTLKGAKKQAENNSTTAGLQLDTEIENLRAALKSGAKERDEAASKLRSAVHAYYATKRLREDLEAADQALQEASNP